MADVAASPAPARLRGLSRIRRVRAELQQLRSSLENVDSKNRVNASTDGDGDGGGGETAKEDVVTIAGDITDLVDDVELMDTRRRRRKGVTGAVSRYAHLPGELVALRKMETNMRDIKNRINNIVVTITESTNSDRPVAGDGYVEFEKDGEKSSDLLVRSLVGEHDAGSPLAICAIVGMAGIGKTSLARKAFDAKEIRTRFEAFAWHMMESTNFNVADALNDISRQLGASTNQESGISEAEEIGRRIEEFLKHRRYLVVLDDVSDTAALEGICKNFPNVGDGSRIMLTTRNWNVAKAASRFRTPLTTTVIEPPLLDPVQSWQFLRKIVLGVTDFAMGDDLVRVGQRIAEKCGGLRLALSVLAEILVRRIDYVSWSMIERDWGLIMIWQRCFDRFDLCYRSLPNLYMKECFLYMAAFPADNVIPVSRLIRSWIAEGFAPKGPRCTSEETARECLDQLIQLNLVQVAERSEIRGCVMKIRIHPMLHHWCVCKARKSGFLNVIDDRTGLASTPVARRVVLRHMTMDADIVASLCNARTILGFALKSDGISMQSLQISDRFHQLRVLDLQGSKGVNNLLKEIAKVVVYLRYLGLRNTNVSELPPAIGNLLLLQTLDARGTQIAKLPATFWKIQTLRNVYWDGAAKLTLQSGVTKNLQKMWIGSREEWDDDGSYNWRQLLRLLEQQDDLMSVTIKASFKRIVPLEVFRTRNLRFLKLFGVLEGLVGIAEYADSLTELTLKWCSLKEDPMPALEKLPNLKSLAFEHNAFVGRSMMCSASGFPQLLHLKLEGWNISKGWNIEDGSMPRLVRLHVTRCFFLSVIPDELRILTTLKELHLSDVPEELGVQIRKDGGKDWPKIQHIPSIKSENFKGPTLTN